MSLAISKNTAFAACRAATKPVHRTFAVSVKAQAGKINPSIKKEEPKVVDKLKAEELPKMAVFCRCWRSSKFPYCDGAHAKHNQETGDNVGPLIVEKSA